MTRIVERQALTVAATLTVTDCASCGAIFALTDEFLARRRADGKSFYCPNGHSLSYNGGDKEKIAKLEQRLKWAQESSKGHERRADAAERSLSATKGVVTKMKKRAAAGVCPYPGCNRHFSNLEAHVKTKHASDIPVGHGDLI